MTFGFLVGSRNFIRLFWVSWEVFVLHGYDKSCTSTAYRWLLRDLLSSLRILWSAVIKSPKMFRTGHDCTSTSSARSPPYFRPQTDIAILVLRKVRVDTMLTRTQYHFCSQLHWKFMRWTGSVSIAWRSVDLVNRTLWIGAKTSYIGSSPRLSTLRNRCIWILWYTTHLWYTFHNSHSILVIAFSFWGDVAVFRHFIWLIINLVMRKQTLVSSLTTRFTFIELALGRMPIFTRRSRVQVPLI